MTMARCRHPRTPGGGPSPRLGWTLLAWGAAAALGFGRAAGTPQDPEQLFGTLETGSPVEALEASARLVGLYDDTMQPRLEKLLGARPLRALQLLGELPTPGSAKLLLGRLPGLLASPDPEVVRMAEVASGLRRLRGATGPLLERTGDKAALRALGRIWDRKAGDPALERADEIDRLSTLALVHRISMGAESSVESCEAMLRTMTGEELDDFVAKHAKDRFYARRFCDEAVRRKGFDPKKGARLHEAFLGNTDADLVGGILDSSPFELPPEAVRALLGDERKTSQGRTVGELARKRLGEK